MGQWKLGYPAGLESVASEDSGRALYNKWLAEAITLSPISPAWDAFKVTDSSGANISVPGLTAGKFNGGYCKVRSGSDRGKVYRIYNTTSTYLTLRNLDNSTPTLSLTNEYVEAVTGPSTFTFPLNRNPNKQDVKIATAGEFNMFPYYTGGIAIPINYDNDFIINCRLTSREDANKLLTFTKLKIDYSGIDAMANNTPAAPLVLECGTHDPNYQYLVHCEEVKEVKEGMRGNIIELQMYLRVLELPSYRGY